MNDTLHTIVLILHMLGATVIIGIAFVSLVIQLKPPLTKDYVTLLNRIWEIVGIALGVQLLTGLYLALSEWEEIGSNPLFWLKMFMIFVIGTIVGLISRKKFLSMQASGKELRTDTNLAWISLLTFAVIAAIGVIIVETANP